MTSSIYLCLGSNSGDRNMLIGRAVSALTDAFACRGGIVRVAEPVRSMPLGFDSPNPFVNVGVLIKIQRSHPWTARELESLLISILSIEKVISSMPHRNADGSYRDREIDIDIIAVDDTIYTSETLTLPHPRMAERLFVLKPMSQLCPDWVHPVLGLTAAQMLHKLESANAK